MSESEPDAVVVGSGPNGLAAAVTLARAGLDVQVYERADTPGGGLRTLPLLDSDVDHDVCAAVHPMVWPSRFMRRFDLESRGVRMLRPDLAYAHPMPGGGAGLAHADLDRTCAGLGEDGPRWRRLMEPLVRRGRGVGDLVLSDLRSLPADPWAAALLGPRVLAQRAGGGPLGTERARALLTGVAGHVIGPLPSLPGSAVSLLLGHLAHTPGGWPIPEGGSASVADALVRDLRAHGGRIHTGCGVGDLRDLPPARAMLLDVAPRGLLALGGGLLPDRYRAALERFRYAPGAAKADFVVSGPVPWADPEVGRAGTVHLGGTQAEMFRAESETARGRRVEEPFVLLVDPAATDPSREVGGRRPVWAYAHVPNGDPRDPVDLVRRRIEGFAPGFTDTIVSARGVPAARMAEYNPNHVGGDIAAGAMSVWQTLARPVPALDPYRTPLTGVYLCSSSTPPGPGVHGMSGHLAALSALRREFGVREVPGLAP
ncbi:phytoene desaturase family protein [Nocardiopsis salina]|uniref:phytoene desaturase family protein n=1 Tax=Nocardiopsis salina TaxID=245836 RepID=UPI000349041C|nr:NAD(P)/FAD-dependent oxidoreductase [Nocardiopsis salina]